MQISQALGTQPACPFPCIESLANRDFPKHNHRLQNVPETILFSVSPLSRRYFSLPINSARQFPNADDCIGSSSSMAAAAEQRRSAASFYSILGVSRDASLAEIRAAYRQLAMTWHPDRCGRERVQVANRRFQQIQEAYEVLSDERRRAMYDAGLYDPRNCEQDGAEDIEGFWDF
ncbi:uncharacterized protein LOC110034782, partial [Phalaenopsis equestris]|uniref:uncharacterized protein LOC110034782 n=1 Tax=Phalaenopsis equestris TaxID=78828 RepID=UPI0009E58EAF